MTTGTGQVELPERETMEFDVVIVGAGPAGLSAAIRLKQLAAENGQGNFGGGARKGLRGRRAHPFRRGHRSHRPQLRPSQLAGGRRARNAARDGGPLSLSRPEGDIHIPHFLMPPLMSNKGNYIVSLGDVVRWLAAKAEALGVEIYPGFPARRNPRRTARAT